MREVLKERIGFWCLCATSGGYALHLRVVYKKGRGLGFLEMEELHYLCVRCHNDGSKVIIVRDPYFLKYIALSRTMYMNMCLITAILNIWSPGIQKIAWILSYLIYSVVKLASP